MSTMITEVYDALISAGAPEDKAKAAAKAIADYDSSKIQADLLLLKWMVGFVLVGVVSMVARSFGS